MDSRRAVVCEEGLAEKTDLTKLAMIQKLAEWTANDRRERSASIAGATRSLRHNSSLKEVFR